ncbi:hypothetical protein D9615_006694 [Tricholomella constricta]|uniref:Deacetylase sirtuin-type domain-containing protein n=1 Tax=Tricholomella constricta TaxID=117010 RepID=A0A8H5M202_9AGAR|nr:hypothetical protein D9615_006694 [Tricholomella constricta]
MGNKQNSPTRKKEQSRESQRTKDIRDLAEYIKSEKCKNVVLMLGAGEFLELDGFANGMVLKLRLQASSNLARLKLPHPEAVFEINFFRRNPVPFYTLAAELYPGIFRPTPTHSFIKVLESQGLLHTCFTQNIDTLERRAGIPAAKIVEAHGSFATQRCVDCKTPFDDEEMREIVLAERAPGEAVRIPRCKRGRCGGLVKPDIVFFGEALPDNFITSIPAISDADMLLIIGTSLTVHPFASLADMADRRTCRRVLINLERVGDIGQRPSDVVLLGECDTIIRELCATLGWTEELDRAWAETTMDSKPKGKVGGEVVVKGLDGAAVEVGSRTDEQEEKEAKKESLEAEVEKIAEALEKRLDLHKHEDEAKAEETGGDPASPKVASNAQPDVTEKGGDETLRRVTDSSKAGDVGKL